MIDINKEAEEYANQKWHGSSVVNSLIKQGVIVGHNSKATQAKVLQVQIDLCNRALSWSNEIDATSDYMEKELIALQQQLKQLENDTING